MKTEDQNRITWNELIYDIYFSLMLFAKAIGLYEGQLAYNIILVLGAGLIICKLLLTEHTLYEYIWMALLGILSLAVYYNSGEKGIVIYTMMILGMKKVSVKRLFAIGAFIWTAAFLSLHLLTMTGLKADVFLVHDKLGLGYVLRWSFGYPHPNVLHISYVILIAFLLYFVKEEKQKLLQATVICFIGNLYVFLYSLSYTGVILATLYLILNYYYCVRREWKTVEKVLISLIYPGCAVFSVLGPLVIRGKLFTLIDKAINTRFSLSKYFLETQPITLFGTRMNVPDYHYTLDCSYTYAFMYFGIIPFLLISAGYIFLIRDCLKRGRRKELAIITGLAVAGITEPFLFNTSYKNLSFLLLGAYLFEASERMEEKLPVILGKKIQWVRLGDRSIPAMGWKLRTYRKSISELIQKKRKTLICGFVLVAVIGGLIYGVTVRMPASIYVPDSITDDIDNETSYLTQEEIDALEESGAWVMAYYGENERMYGYDGNIITLEYIRGVISTGIWAGGCGALLLLVFLHHKNRRAIMKKVL